MATSKFFIRNVALGFRHGKAILRSERPMNYMPALMKRTLAQSILMDSNSLNVIRQSPVALFSTTSIRKDEEGKIKRPESMGSRSKQATGEGRGPVSWFNAAFSGVVLGILLAAYYYGKHRKEEALARERQVEIGKSKIGGRFELIDHNNKLTKSEDFLGKWVLLYFGFTHCPDICPDEMEKLAEVTDKLKEMSKTEKAVTPAVPMFITVDPDRDGVKEVAEYIKEFHPEIIGLTGNHEQIKEACKAYRVYFSAGPRDEDGDDYIVDHTIIIYLINPDGEFVDYYGQTKTSDQILTSVSLQMAKYEQLNKKSFFSFS